MTPICLRDLTVEERARVQTLAHARSAPAQTVQRAQIIWRASHGESASAIAARLGLDGETVRKRIHRFNAEGVEALKGKHRSGRPPTYPPEQTATVIATALIKPETLGLPFAAWTLDRLAAYLHEEQDLVDAAQPNRRDPAPRGLALAQTRDLVRRADRSGLRGKKGAIETLYTTPPAGSCVICLDEMGPVSAKSYAGRALVQSRTRPAERAKQEIDYGRRAKGYIFGAFCPATGEAFTHPYPGRGGAHWVDFLEHVETWVPSTTKRVYAIMDNLSSHCTTDVLLFLLAHPRWEMVFQPKYAAYLNLIEPWWKILRSLALAGRRFETWEEIVDAIHCSTVYWNAHRHPFVWGRRRRHRPRRSSCIALLPKAA